MTDLRDSGMQTGGPRAFSEQDKRKFASSFDKIINKKMREQKIREQKMNNK